MITPRLRGHLPAARIAAGIVLCATATFSPFVQAQVVSNITSDGTLGTTVTGAGVYEINGGTLNGNNQFHSFDRFSVGTGDAALFNGPAGIQNIVSRVTGHLTSPAPSEIDGYLGSSIIGANMFLMNPAGIMFGPNAQLDVSGSFHATTADYLRLGADGVGIFYADPAKATVLTASAPTAFGFLSNNPATIDVNTSSLLMGALGQTLSFVGGNVNVGAADGSAPGYVLSPAGRVNFVSVASLGEAAFDGTGFNVDSVAQLGQVNIQGGSIVDGKDVFVRAGQLTIDEGIIFPNVFYFFGLAPAADGGEVNIKVSDSVTIKGTGPDPLTDSPPGIFVFSGDFFATDVAGKVPDVKIDAKTVSISGFAGIQSDRLGPGASGDVIINADTVNVASGGSIALFNTWEGPGGNLIINARDLNISGDGSPSAVGFEGIGSQGLMHPLYGASVDPALTFGDSGNINLNLTGTLNVQGQAQIITDSLNFGRGGDISINAADIVLVGSGAETGLIGAQSAFAGDAGNISVSATGTIQIKNGFRISSSTVGTGHGGSVSVNAGKSITFEGADSRILSVTVPQPDDEQNALFLRTFGIDFDTLRAILADFGYPADADLFTVLGGLNDFGFTQIPGELKAGDGGTVVVNTPLLTMNAGTRIETSTGWDGNAGAAQLNVGSLVLNGGASLNSTSGFQRLTGEAIIGTGNAGAIDVTASDSITVSGQGSVISTSTFGDGSGGDVTLTAGNQVSILDGGRISADSGGTLGGSEVSGTGFTGNVTITSSDTITLDGGTISTRAVTSDGGNINLFAPNIVYLNDSQITTSVESGVGGGGNIFIDPQFVILNNSSIIANAFGGPGGNITIVADNFLASASSIVEASSALSTPGVIQIVSPDNNVESSIQVLTAAFLDASSQLRGLCSARRTGAPSSFTVASRGGVPIEADGYLPSFATDAAAATAGAAGPVSADAGSIGGAQLALVMPDSLNCMR